jgi:hypothetical protein
MRRLAAAAIVPLLALAATGCAPARDDDLFGLDLEVRTEQAWGRDPALRRRLHALIEDGCAHVGLDPSLLYGMTLRLEDGGVACGGTPDARGCTERSAGIIQVSTLAWSAAEPPVPCVEDTPIPHELLHVAIGDPEHRDPRWRAAGYWEPLWRRVTRADCSGDAPSLMW